MIPLLTFSAMYEMLSATAIAAWCVVLISASAYVSRPCIADPVWRKYALMMTRYMLPYMLAGPVWRFCCRFIRALVPWYDMRNPHFDPIGLVMHSDAFFRYMGWLMLLTVGYALMRVRVTFEQAVMIVEILDLTVRVIGIAACFKFGNDAGTIISLMLKQKQQKRIG